MFIKTYSNDSTYSQFGFFIEELNDEGFIIVSVENNYPLIMRTDKYGSIISQRAVPDNSFNVAGGFLVNFSTTGDPWHFLAQAGRLIMRFDSSGKIACETLVPLSGFGPINTNTFIRGAVQNGTGFLVPYCDGTGGTISTTNKIYSYDGNLKLLKTDSISDLRLGGHTQLFYLSPGIQSAPYTIFGQKFPRTYWNSTNNTKLFAARVPVTGKPTQTMIDTGDQLTSDNYTWQAISNDSDVVMLGDRVNSVNTLLKYPIVIKFDKNLKVVWKQVYDVDYGNVGGSNIVSCRDGGFLILGSIGRAGYPETKPYALKIDANGNKQWEKTLTSTTGTGELLWGIQLADGGYAFVGDTQQFGKGIGTRLIFVRTDANGNF
jgi:hypothetical protein